MLNKAMVVLLVSLVVSCVSFVGFLGLNFESIDAFLNGRSFEFFTYAGVTASLGLLLSNYLQILDAFEFMKAWKELAWKTIRQQEVLIGAQVTSVLYFSIIMFYPGMYSLLSYLAICVVVGVIQTIMLKNINKIDFSLKENQACSFFKVEEE